MGERPHLGICKTGCRAGGQQRCLCWNLRGRKSPSDSGAFPGGSCSVAREGLEARDPAGGGHQDQADQGVEPQHPARW